MTPPSSSSRLPVEILQVLFGQAQEGVVGCFVHGGRYWEVTMDLAQLLDLLPEANRSVFLEGVCRMLPPAARASTLAGFLPSRLRLSMCTPHDCTPEWITSILIPEFEAGKMFGSQAASLLTGIFLQDVVNVQEVLNWPSLHLDFAIAGVDNCGTTSLHRNLEQHPEIAFSSSEEDFFFVSDVVHRLLPLRSQVEEFNRRIALAKDKKWQETSQFVS